MENDEFNVQDLAKDLVAYTVVNSPTYKPPETSQYELTDMQTEYITGIMQGTQPKELCLQLGLSRMQPYLWKKQSRLFAEALELVAEMKADELENELWNKATTEGANPIMQMFLLKRARPEYRDNAAPPTANTVNLHVTIGGQEFKVVAEQNGDD